MFERKHKVSRLFLETVRDHWGVKSDGGEVNPSLNISLRAASSSGLHNHKQDNKKWLYVMCSLMSSNEPMLDCGLL